MSQYLFTLGRSWEAALAELNTVFCDNAIKICIVRPPFVQIESADKLDTDKLIHSFGGTVKIASVFECFKKENEIEEKIIKTLTQEVLPKVTFAVSFLGQEDTMLDLVKRIKEKLKEKGITGRYILPKTPTGLSSVVISKQHVLEFVVYSYKKMTYLAKTIAVQDFLDWGKRDYGRPAIDPKKGMLPPKVARIMVNLAFIAYKRQKTMDRQAVLLDPFCGVGTIPMEALLLGWDIVASDCDLEMVEKTQKNIAWLKKEYATGGHDEYYSSDATHISEKITENSVDAIVTEPNLGPNFEIMPNVDYVNRVSRGLEKLYIGSLREWHRLLKTKGLVVIAFPEFRLKTKTIACKKAIDNCEKLGYTLISGPFLYSRPQAIVTRKIYVLRKNQ
jgi:tRNA G10  N-methylase Trm11